MLCIKGFPMTGLKNRISGVESDQSTNFPQPLHNLKFIQALVFKADHIRFIESSPPAMVWTKILGARQRGA